MKILFVLARYLPQKNGGIETYSHILAKLLLKNGHTVNVCILNGTELHPYTYEQVVIIPLQDGINSFTSLLQEKKIDICHFQEYSGVNGINILWLKTATLYCKKVFFTFHMPYLTCYKSDFRYLGIDDCNTFDSDERCTRCIIATKLKYQKNAFFNFHNLGINLLTPLLIKTAFIKQLRNRIQNRQDDLRELLLICDKVFLIANWFREILIQNGYESSSMVTIPPFRQISLNNQTTKGNNLRKRIFYVGRIEYQKGLLLLCKAMNVISTNDVQLDVFGNQEDKIYFKDCTKEFAFNYKGTLPHSELLQLFGEYDFLILPSVCTEMYPLVIQEAFAVNLPVIASSAKGNIGVVKEGKNGFLFNYDDYKDLASVIDKAYSLKKKGWLPEFEIGDSHENDVKEILSYYS